MANSFSNLRDKMSPERRARNQEAAAVMLAEMPLHELRRARELSQASLAEVLGVQQGTVSKMERRTDMYLSTLRSYIKAMGGDLVIEAKFPDGVIVINQFHDLEAEQEQVTDKAIAA
jgi:DNA-binding transcriptional regulator YiaG